MERLRSRPMPPDNTAVAGVQFYLDQNKLGSAVTGSGPAYSVSWNTTGVANGTHVLSAIATDTSGNAATSAGVSVTVSNPPLISGVSAAAVNASSESISWTTNVAANSQVAYGTTAAYGSTSPSAGGLATAHTVTLTGLSTSTTYHYQVLSTDAQGNLAASGDFTFTTGSAPSSLP